MAEVPPAGFWYSDGLEYGANTSINIFFYGMHLAGATRESGYLADAIRCVEGGGGRGRGSGRELIAADFCAD